MSNPSPVLEPRRGHGSSAPGCSNCCARPSRRIVPTSGPFPGYKIIEVRPNRHLRIRHINPVPRSPEFDVFMKERKQRQSSGKARKLPMNLNLLRQKTKQHIVPHSVSESQELKTVSPSTHRPKTGSNGQNHSGSGQWVDEISHGLSHLPEPSTERTRTASSVDLDITITSNTVINNEAMKLMHGGHSSLKASSAITSESVKRKDTKEDKATATIFLIHGVGGSADVWQAQIDHFGGKGYEIIAPDLIGHGFSSMPSKPNAYHFSQIADDVLEVFDRFCKDKNVVIGHSYGCSFAAVVARKRHRYVHKLVFVSGGSPTPLAPQPGVFTVPVCLLACCRPVMESRFRKNVFHGDRKTYIPREKTFDIPTFVLKAVMNGQDWMEGDAEYHQWLNVQTLLIHGRSDGLVSLEDEEEMKQAIYGSELEIVDDASHMVMIENPEKVNELIEHFLLSGLSLRGVSDEAKKQKSVTCFDNSGQSNAASAGAGVTSSALSLQSVRSVPDADH